MMFLIMDTGHTALLPVWSVLSKNFKFKLKEVNATKNTSMHSRASVEVSPKSQTLLQSKELLIGRYKFNNSKILQSINMTA
jgi:hypothetical protein